MPRTRADFLRLALLLLYPLALTWPLALHAGHAVPQGSEPSATVPLFNLWTLGWNVRQLAQGYPAYWDAPIFWPAPGAFAYSDPQPLGGLLAASVWARSPALAYNLVLWLYLALNGLSVYGLLRRCAAAPPGPALLAGLLAQSLPYLTHERGVLQLQPYFGMVWAAEGAWTLLRGGSRRSGAALLAAGLSAAFLTSGYYGVFLLALLPPLAAGMRPRRARWGWLLFGGLAGILPPLLTLLPQRAILLRMGFSRSAETIARNSACPGDYLRLTPFVRAAESWSALPACRQYLFPGAGLTLLGLAGLVLALRGRRRPWGLALLSSGAAALLLSFGLRLTLGGWQPYGILRARLPGFENLRSPFRFGLWVQVTLALLSALALEALWKRRRALGLAAALLALLELFPRPAALTPVPPPYPAEALSGVTLFLPYPSRSAAAAYEPAAAAMWRALPTRARLVNGYSGYFPALNSQLKTLLADFPDALSLRVLRALGAQTLCWPPAWPDEARQARVQALLAAGTLRPAARLDDAVCYRLSGSRLRPAGEYRGAWAVKAERAGGRVRLRAYAAVPDAAVYAAFPGALAWRARWLSKTGERLGERTFSPLGAVLLYRGSNRWLPSPWFRPPQGAAAAQLWAGDALLGEVILP